MFSEPCFIAVVSIKIVFEIHCLKPIVLCGTNLDIRKVEHVKPVFHYF